MSDLTKHTLTIKITDRIEWINKRCGLSEIQKDYITAQMKEAVNDAVQQAIDVTEQQGKALQLPVVRKRFINWGDFFIGVIFGIFGMLILLAKLL